jgi:hypothetical protein
MDAAVNDQEARFVPSWKIRQTQRRRNRVAWVALQAALMVGAVIVFLWSLKMLFPAVHAQTLVGSSQLKFEVMKPEEIKTMQQWKDTVGWETVMFTGSAPDGIKICAGDKRCITLGELRAMKPKESK